MAGSLLGGLSDGLEHLPGLVLATAGGQAAALADLQHLRQNAETWTVRKLEYDRRFLKTSKK